MCVCVFERERKKIMVNEIRDKKIKVNRVNNLVRFKM